MTEPRPSNVRRGHGDGKSLGRDMVEVSIRVKDFKVPYPMKKAFIRPILMALKEAILDTGEISIQGFGTFYVYRKKVNRTFGSKDKVSRIYVAFRPYKSFLLQVNERWSKKAQLFLESSEPGQQSLSPQGNVESAGGEVSQESSVTEGHVGNTSTILSTES